MKHYKKTQADIDALAGKDIPAPVNQPKDYAGYVVMKPWGYEFQVFDNGECSIWIACLNPGQAVSMHCHPNKKAMFVPLTDGVTFRTLHGAEPLIGAISVDYGVLHSQENNTNEDVYFLEYEWPSNKADLVRHADRYGREAKGYEGTSEMIPLAASLNSILSGLIIKQKVA